MILESSTPQWVIVVIFGVITAGVIFGAVQHLRK